jgi:hypothetical protein
LAGFGDFNAPDMILREDELSYMLPQLARRYGHQEPPVPEPPQETANAPFPLAEIYDDEIESLVAEVYQRDYVMFGFGPWKPAD